MIKIAIFVNPNYILWKISSSLELMKYWNTQSRRILSSSNEHCLCVQWFLVNTGDSTGQLQISDRHAQLPWRNLRESWAEQAHLTVATPSVSLNLKSIMWPRYIASISAWSINGTFQQNLFSDRLLDQFAKYVNQLAVFSNWKVLLHFLNKDYSQDVDKNAGSKWLSFQTDFHERILSPTWALSQRWDTDTGEAAKFV